MSTTIYRKNTSCKYCGGVVANPSFLKRHQSSLRCKVVRYEKQNQELLEENRKLKQLWTRAETNLGYLMKYISNQKLLKD